MPRPRQIGFALALAAALGTTAGWAARRDPAPPLTLVAGPAAVLTVTGGSPAKIQWGVSPEAPHAASGNSLLVWGPPGSYQVTAAVLMSGDVGLLQGTAIIGPGPEPSPAPGPGPIVPVAEPVWALAVFDTSRQISLPAGQLALFKSQTVVAALKPLGVTYRHYDVADPAVTGSTWGTAALKLQKPALVLWRAKRICPGYPVNLPATEADLVALCRSAVNP